MWFKTILEWFGYVIDNVWAQNSDFGCFHEGVFTMGVFTMGVCVIVGTRAKSKNSKMSNNAFIQHFLGSLKVS